MTVKKQTHHARSVPDQQEKKLAGTSPAARRGPRLVLAGAALLALVAMMLYIFVDRPPTPVAASQKSDPVATYMGAAACVSCHASESAAWHGSQHAMAMQEANPQSVLGNFNDAEFTHAGVTNRFYRRDDEFYVRTDGPDGKLTDYRIAYTFGVNPLQQYLIEFPDGRLQALPIAWDTRPAAEGGQHWFHLHPDEAITHDDELHWTRPAQNWNFMCADCHSTGLRKNYDPETNRFHTQWAEIDVACEACHGPGSRHLAWAQAKQEGKPWQGDDKGLTVRLDYPRLARTR